MNFLQKVTSFFENLIHGDPTVQAAASTVAQNLKSAASAAEAAADPIVNAAANAALGLLPLGLGADIDPFADALIDQVIAKLEGKKSTASAGSAASATTTGTVTANAPTGASSPNPSAADIGAGT